MNKKIANKSYSTDTAQRICDWGENLDSEAHRKYECLYMKKSGEFFLYAAGGYRTIYSQYGEGIETIIPLTKEDAYEWAEKHDLRKYVDDALKRDPAEMRQFMLRIGGIEHDRIKKKAEEYNISFAEYVRRCLWLYDPENNYPEK